MFSTARTAQQLDISTDTLKRWYKWYENDGYAKPTDLVLPSYITDNRGTKFFDEKAIKQLLQFKEDLQGKYRGCMAEFNSKYQWGIRGKKIQENKKRKENKIE